MKYIEKFFEYLLAMFIVLECNSVYSRYAGTKNYLLAMLVLALLALIIVNFLKHKKLMIKNSMYLYGIIYFLYIDFYMFYTKLTDIKFMYLFIVCLPLLVLLYLFDKNNSKKILEAILNIVFVLCIVSLVFWILGPMLNIIHPSGSVTIDWGIMKTVPSYFNLHFITQKAGIFHWFLTRNTGVFAEAPMYSLVLLIGLITNLFISEKKSVLKTLIILIGIISTVSTTGIILSCLAIGCSYIMEKQKSTNKKVFLIILAVVVLLVSVISIVFLRDKLSSMSYRTRIDDYEASVKAWEDHIIMGNGFDNELAIRNYMSDFRKNNMGLSNSLFTILALGGLYLFIIYLIPFIITIKNNIRINNKIIVYSCMIIIMFSLLIFHYKVLMINFLAIGYSYLKYSKDDLNE